MKNHLQSSRIKKSVLLLGTFLMLVVSCSDNEQVVGSVDSSLESSSESNSAKSSVADKGDGKGEDGKGCGEGEVYETETVRYECISGEWVLTKGDDSKDSVKDQGEGELLSLTLSHNALSREYLLYTPQGYDGSSKLPMMLNFHGFGGTMNGHMGAADMRTLADSENFILVYPQGSPLDGYSHWNSSLPGGDNKSEADDFGFINALINKVASEYEIDTTRVYASGYSNGGFMSHSLACYAGDKIAAIAGVAGSILDAESCAPAHKTAVMVVHGTADETVLYEGSNGFSSVEGALDYWIDFNETNTAPVTESYIDGSTTIERYSYSDASNQTYVEHYKVIDGGHIWFKFNYNGSTTNELIWEFVSQWSLEGKL